MADQTLDAKGLNCPLPILKTKKMIKGMTSGQTLAVIATDPGSIADMTAFLASDLSGYTTGTIVTVDGGMINKGPLF